MAEPVTKFTTLEVERLLIREPGGGRVRAVLETAMEPTAEGCRRLPESAGIWLSAADP